MRGTAGNSLDSCRYRRRTLKSTNKYRTIDLYGFEIQRCTSPGEIFHVRESGGDEFPVVRFQLRQKRGCIKSLGLSGADSGFSGSASFGVLLAVCGSVSGSGGLLLGCLGLVFGFYVVDFADVVSHCDPSELEAGFV